MVVMPVAMIMPMLMTVLVIMGVRISMSGGISACFRIEWRTDGMNVTTQPAHHVRNHVVIADQDTFFLDHGRQMPVSQMPSHTQQMQCVMTGHFQQVFLLRFDPHHTSVFQ